MFSADPQAENFSDNEIGKTIKISLERSMGRINASFNDCRLVHFDIAVHTLLKSSGLRVAFNRLDSSHDQPVMGCGSARASLRWRPWR
jgi:hypothetical protein